MLNPQRGGRDIMPIKRDIMPMKRDIMPMVWSVGGYLFYWQVDDGLLFTVRANLNAPACYNP